MFHFNNTGADAQYIANIPSFLGVTDEELISNALYSASGNQFDINSTGIQEGGAVDIGNTGTDDTIQRRIAMICDDFCEEDLLNPQEANVQGSDANLLPSPFLYSQLGNQPELGNNVATADMNLSDPNGGQHGLGLVNIDWDQTVQLAAPIPDLSFNTEAGAESTAGMVVVPEWEDGEPFAAAVYVQPQHQYSAVEAALVAADGDRGNTADNSISLSLEPKVGEECPERQRMRTVLDYFIPDTDVLNATVRSLDGNVIYSSQERDHLLGGNHRVTSGAPSSSQFPLSDPLVPQGNRCYPQVMATGIDMPNLELGLRQGSPRWGILPLFNPAAPSQSHTVGNPHPSNSAVPINPPIQQQPPLQPLVALETNAILPLYRNVAASSGPAPPPTTNQGVPTDASNLADEPEVCGEDGREGRLALRKKRKPSLKRGRSAVDGAQSEAVGKARKRTRTRVEDLEPSKVHRCTHPGCGSEFAKKYSLKVHERQHRGEIPYICPVPNCGKPFMWPSSFSRHMKVHERKQKPPAPEPRKQRVATAPPQNNNATARGESSCDGVEKATEERREVSAEQSMESVLTPSSVMAYMRVSHNRNAGLQFNTEAKLEEMRQAELNGMKPFKALPRLPLDE